MERSARRSRSVAYTQHCSDTSNPGVGRKSKGAKSMNDILKSLATVGAILVLILGLNQLSTGKEILQESLLPCCNNGVCEVEYCDSESSVDTKSDCVSRTILCCECVELTVRGCLCNNSRGSQFCLNRDGSKYYGHGGPCTSHPPCTQTGPH